MMTISSNLSEKSSRFVHWLTSFLVVAAGAGLVRLGAIPVMLAGLLAWPVAKWVSRLVERHMQSNILRVLMSVILVVVMLLTSTFAGLLASKASASDTNTQVKIEQLTQHSSGLTEAQLLEMATAENKKHPTRVSENLELTRIEAGPGMLLTYHVRILAEGVSFTEAELNGVRNEAINEACVSFKPGLSAGLTYVMAYNNSDGSLLFRVPITIQDCGGSP